jgi:hypothetical protein
VWCPYSLRLQAFRCDSCIRHNGVPWGRFPRLWRSSRRLTRDTGIEHAVIYRWHLPFLSLTITNCRTVSHKAFPSPHLSVLFTARSSWQIYSLRLWFNFEHRMILWTLFDRSFFTSWLWIHKMTPSKYIITESEDCVLHSSAHEVSFNCLPSFTVIWIIYLFVFGFWVFTLRVDEVP